MESENDLTHQPRSLQQKPLVLVSVALLIAVIAGTGEYLLGIQTGSNTNKQLAVQQSIAPQPTTPTDLPTLTPEPFTWHLNTTQQWTTYTNPDGVFTLQYPPGWEYYDSGNLEGRGFLLRKSANPRASTYNIDITWQGSFGDPPHCTSRPTIQLKNESLQGCEYSLNDGTDAMQIDKFTPTVNAYIRLRTITNVSRDQLLQILSTLEFTR